MFPSAFKTYIHTKTCKRMSTAALLTKPDIALQQEADNSPWSIRPHLTSLSTRAAAGTHSHPQELDALCYGEEARLKGHTLHFHPCDPLGEAGPQGQRTTGSCPQNLPQRVNCSVCD